MSAIISISVILIILGVVALFYGISEEKKENHPLILFSLIVITITAIQVGFILIEPSALDVYQGKTTLQITYRDSIPVDSVVVFK